jgi:prolyl oligopeptidase PreP (S9A serine peptidase family)
MVSFLQSHTTENYFSDSAFWHVPSDFKKLEEERGREII